MGDLNELLARVEAASPTGDLALDWALAELAYPEKPTPRVVGAGDFDANRRHREALADRQPTTSLDAILELVAGVLPGWGAEVGYPARMGQHGGRPWADLWMARDDERLQKGERWPRQGPCHSNAATPAIAVCCALLRALIAQAEARSDV